MPGAGLPPRSCRNVSAETVFSFSDPAWCPILTKAALKKQSSYQLFSKNFMCQPSRGGHFKPSLQWLNESTCLQINAFRHHEQGKRCLGAWRGHP